MPDSQSVKLLVGVDVVTRARVSASENIECRLVDGEAVLSFAGGTLQVTLTEPALEKLVDETREVFDEILRKY